MSPKILTALLAILVVWAGLAALPVAAEETTLSQRLEVFPTSGLPLDQPLTIHWNEHQVPFIEAGTDRDLAFALGLVQAHLRLGQISFLRMISQGRVSEMAGPFTIDIDRSLRILNFGKAVPAILKAMPPDDREWLERYVEGINYYQDQLEIMPREFGMMGIPKERWTPSDILIMGRLASTDVNWIVFFRLLRQHKREDWAGLWKRLVREGTTSNPSYTAAADWRLEWLTSTLLQWSRSGSNSVVVSAGKSASGSALIASDPHLGIMLPNFWLIVGYKSPSYHAVGLMPVGLPLLALGRNMDIAWGATNLRAASSDLFDISDLPPEQITERTEPIRVRFWIDREVTIRETPYGPVISDVPLLALDEFEGWRLALKWLGHQPSNEMGAMLRMNRARNWEEFRAAIRDFSVPGQNMHYADKDGHIGQVMAVQLPNRPKTAPKDITLPVEAASAWEEILTSEDLPYSFDPPRGFLASANNRGSDAQVPIGYFFSSNDRISRLSEILDNDNHITIDDLARMQRDVYMGSAVVLRDGLVERIGALNLREELDDDERSVLAAMEGWDGHYRADSPGALAFELVASHLIEEMYDEMQMHAYLSVGRPYLLIAEDLKQAGPQQLRELLPEVLDDATYPFEEFGTWGEMHRMPLAHPLGNAPIIGGNYRFGDLPASGSSATVMKTAHRTTNERHKTRYGSNARHISDMSDPDMNLFVLLGGQDGWLGSSTFLSLHPLWEAGTYIQVPLRLESVRKTFPHRLVLQPKSN